MNKLSIYILLLFIFLQCAPQRAVQKSQIDFITVAEEIQLGELIQERLLSQFKVIRNSKVQEYFNLMATEISLQSKWQDLPYTVYIVNQPEPLHFSTPGGGIFIYRGVVEKLQNHQECAALLALHIAHINLRHSVELISHEYGYAIAAQRVMGENPNIAQDIVNKLFTSGSILNYSEKMLMQVDHQAIEYLEYAGYSPQYLAKVLIRLDAALEKTDNLPTFFHSSNKRIKHVKQITRKKNISSENTLFEKDFSLILSTISQIPL